MERKQYQRIGETVYYDLLPNGLPVYVVSKPGYSKSYAFFATDYGGMDLKFQFGDEWRDTPAGVAHFLEHKMFDTEDGNALQELSMGGASPNAFTSNAITAYFFESTERFAENLKILLSFVSVPYFTEESVAKEQGIIGQEIRMVEDNPDWVVYNNLTQALYQHNPVRVSVAGSVDSIAQITAETLYACHKVFYQPSNMVLCVVGDVDPEQIVAAAKEILPQEDPVAIQRDYGEAEAPGVYQQKIQCEMEVGSPIFLMGVKLPALEDGAEWQRQQLLAELSCEALLGSSSPLYARLYEQGLINHEFGSGVETVPQAAYLVAGGESRDPDAVYEEILAEAERLGREGIDPDLWERLKRAAYGSWIRGLNSFENICIHLAEAHFRKAEYLKTAEDFDLLTREMAEEYLRTHITRDKAALSVVRPKRAGQ